MKKYDINMNVLSDSELDQIILLLEASYATTGDSNIFKVIDILMHDTHCEIINNNKNAIRPEQPSSS